jgi:hypothetical protein
MGDGRHKRLNGTVRWHLTADWRDTLMQHKKVFWGEANNSAIALFASET